MSKHDSIIWIRDGGIFDPIIPLFPEGIPVRDPFPMNIQHGEKFTKGLLATWVLDLQRMGFSQKGALTRYFENWCIECNIKVKDTQHLIDNFFFIPNQEVIFLEVGAEGHMRTLELSIYLRKPNQESLQEFFDDQTTRWVKGEETPETAFKKLDFQHIEDITKEHCQKVMESLNNGDRCIVTIPPLGEMIEEYSKSHSLKLVQELEDNLAKVIFI